MNIINCMELFAMKLIKFNKINQLMNINCVLRLKENRKEIKKRGKRITLTYIFQKTVVINLILEKL